jgi:signal transduction histidine kinase
MRLSLSAPPRASPALRDRTHICVCGIAHGCPALQAATGASSKLKGLQEALTNAHKYGCGEAKVRLHDRLDALELVVTNRVAGDRQTSGGFGLVGMRERVHAAGGELTTNLMEGKTFVVEATFPRTRAQLAP